MPSDSHHSPHPRVFLPTRISGPLDNDQIVTIRLERDQVLRAGSGAMMYMTQGVQMNATTGGGLSAGFRRMLTGRHKCLGEVGQQTTSRFHRLVLVGIVTANTGRDSVKPFRRRVR